MNLLRKSAFRTASVASFRRFFPVQTSAMTKSFVRSTSTNASKDHKEEEIEIVWKDKNGKVTKTVAHVGDSLLIAARAGSIDLEGACEGVCACSTCHVILEYPVYESLPEASEDEEDMLDQAFGLTSTSRLGCQIVLKSEHNGIIVQLPKATRNFYVVCRFFFILGCSQLNTGWSCPQTSLVALSVKFHIIGIELLHCTFVKQKLTELK